MSVGDRQLLNSHQHFSLLAIFALPAARSWEYCLLLLKDVIENYRLCVVAQFVIKALLITLQALIKSIQSTYLCSNTKTPFQTRAPLQPSLFVPPNPNMHIP